MKVELVYFEGCPNVLAARSNLRKAFQAIGVQPEWTEWERGDPKLPQELKAYGSPSILVDGTDVAPAGDGEDCGKTCRLYGGNENAPSVENLIKVLRKGLGR